MKKFIALLLISCFCLTACTSTELTTIEAIVTAAELVVPVLPGIPAAELPAIQTYINAALKIAEDLLNNPSGPQLKQAVTDFQSLAQPQLNSSLDPKTAALIGGISSAIGNFVTNFKTVPVTTAIHSPYIRSVAEPDKAPTTITKKDQKKITKLLGRIKTLRGKVGGK